MRVIEGLGAEIKQLTIEIDEKREKNMEYES
jgi:hypothetical protein